MLKISPMSLKYMTVQDCKRSLASPHGMSTIWFLISAQLADLPVVVALSRLLMCSFFRSKKGSHTERFSADNSFRMSEPVDLSSPSRRTRQFEANL